MTEALNWYNSVKLQMKKLRSREVKGFVHCFKLPDSGGKAHPQLLGFLVYAPSLSYRVARHRFYSTTHGLIEGLNHNHEVTTALQKHNSSTTKAVHCN